MSTARELTLVQLNDLHGYIEPHAELFWTGRGADYRIAGGCARIATLLNQFRAERPGRTLVLDGGDTVHGTYVAVQSQGAVLVPILNALGIDGMTGHWDFAYGPEHLRQLVAQLGYPFLAANCYQEGTGRPAFEPYTVREVGGVRVGVIGLAATIVDKVMPPRFSEGLRFTLGRDELPDTITRLRGEEGAELVVVLSHLGFPQDMQLCEDVAGIDVLLSAHTHNRLRAPARVNETLVIQSGSHGSFLGRLDLEIEGGRVRDFRHALITVSDATLPDPEVAALVEAALAPHRALLDEVVGFTATALNRATSLEATMDNLLLQSLLDATEAEIAFSNGWRYGAPVPPGPITANDLWNIIPVNPPVSLVELTGAELWEMWEENLEHVFARNPYDQMGGYVKRSVGLRLTIKAENPAGHRVQELFVRGEAVRPERVYRATFVTTQGVPERYGANRRDLDLRAIDALWQYLARAGGEPVRAELRGTVIAA